MIVTETDELNPSPLCSVCGVIFGLHVWNLYGIDRGIAGLYVLSICDSQIQTRRNSSFPPMSTSTDSVDVLQLSCRLWRVTELSSLVSSCKIFELSRNFSTDSFFLPDVDFSPPAQQYLNFYGCIAAGKPGKSIAPTIILFAFFSLLSLFVSIQAYKLSTLSWSAPLVFSLVVLGLALYRCLTMRGVGGDKISVVRALLRDGIWYLSVPVVVNLVSVIFASRKYPSLH